MRVHKGSLIERLLYPYVRRIITAYDDARRLTWKHCPACKTPLVEGQANFCHICGTCLVPQLPAPKPVPIAEQSIAVAPVALPLAAYEPAIMTDAVYNLNQRPLQTFIAARQQQKGIHTAMTEAIAVEKLRKQRKSGTS